MPLVELSLEAIPDLLEMANEAVRRAAASVIDNPHETAARTVTVVIKVKPEVTGPAGAMRNLPEISGQVKYQEPSSRTFKTKGVVQQVGKDGAAIMLNPGDPAGNYPDQPTFEDAPAKEGK